MTCSGDDSDRSHDPLVIVRSDRLSANIDAEIDRLRQPREEGAVRFLVLHAARNDQLRAGLPGHGDGDVLPLVLGDAADAEQVAPGVGLTFHEVVIDCHTVGDGHLRGKQLAVLSPLVLADGNGMQPASRRSEGGRAFRAKLAEPAAVTGDVKCHDDRRCRGEPSVVDVLEPLMHVNDVDVARLRAGECAGEVKIDAGLPLPRPRVAVVAQAPGNGVVLLARHRGICRARDNRPVAERVQAFIDVVDNRFNGAIAVARANGLVDGAYVEDGQRPGDLVQVLPNSAGGTCRIVAGGRGARAGTGPVCGWWRCKARGHRAP